jgi:dTDP-4-dehydrorhamnose 3,5-epimerase
VQKIETSLPGVWELRPPTHSDHRGYFVEGYHAERCAGVGIHDTFVQDNHYYSVHGALRGLHYQLKRPQAKLCRVLEGIALDVVVDIRRGSPTFGKSAVVLLSAELRNQLYIPAGFAQGFLSFRGPTQFLYKCSTLYDPTEEHGILWNDPDLAIPWHFANPLVSAKDSSFRTLKEILTKSPNDLPHYGATE